MGDSPQVWRVEMLGGYRVSGAEGQAEFRTKKTAGLLAYLAYYAGKPVPKDRLVDSFWPEADLDRGRQSLRTALSAIRSALANPVVPADRLIESDHTRVCLVKEHFWVDTVEFQRSCAERHDQDLAYKIYQGPLLSEFTDPWIVPQALDLEESYVSLVKALVAGACERDDADRAANLARGALAIYPEREELHICLMRAYSAAGLSAAVVQQLEHLEKMLDDLWGETPSDEAYQLLEALPPKVRRPIPKVEESADDMPLPRESRLVVETGRLFGRETELEALTEWLSPAPSDPRIVTLTGLGGTGKTRLAEATALRLDEAYRGATWLVSLASVTEPVAVADAIVAKVAPDQGKAEPLKAVQQALGGRPGLIVLDNLEHLLPDAAATVADLLHAVPRLKLLATSRVALGLDSERLFPVKPLALPKTASDLEELRSAPSVQLLVEAAQQARPGFSVSPINARGVFELCSRLDGIPLAIRLAASRLATKTPSQVVGSLSRRSDLDDPGLKVGDRLHRLDNVIEWNVSQLNPGVKRSFARLSVCVGGFDARLAARILDVPAEDTVEELVRLSLLTWVETPESLRYEMLETVRQIASDHLAADPDEQQEAWRSLLEFTRDLAAEKESDDGLGPWLARVDAEVANVVSVLDPSANPILDIEDAWTVLTQFQDHVWRRGRYQTWLACAESLLENAQGPLTLSTQVAAHRLVGGLAYGLRDIELTYRHYERAVKAADQLGDKDLMAQARSELVIPASLMGRFDDCIKSLEETLDLVPESESPVGYTHALLNLGWVLFDSGQEEASTERFRQALASAERSGRPESVAACLVGLAAAVGQSDLDESIALFDRAESIWRREGHLDRHGHCLFYRALVEYRNGRLDMSLLCAQQSFENYLDFGIRLGQTPLTVMGNLMAAIGRPEHALALWGRADESRKQFGTRMFPTLAKDYRIEHPKASETVSPERAARVMEWATEATDLELYTYVFKQKGGPDGIVALET